MRRSPASDNGVGVEETYHDKIFEIFQWLKSTNTGEGTGIGLALCRRIVHGFSGGIWVESTPSICSTFLFHPAGSMKTSLWERGHDKGG